MSETCSSQNLSPNLRREKLYKGNEFERMIVGAYFNDQPEECPDFTDSEDVEGDCIPFTRKMIGEIGYESRSQNDQMYEEKDLFGDCLEGSTPEGSTRDAGEQSKTEPETVKKVIISKKSKKRQANEDIIKFKKLSKKESLKPSSAKSKPAKSKPAKSSSSDDEKQMDESDSEAQVMDKRKRRSPLPPGQYFRQAYNCSNDIIKIVSSVFLTMYGVLQQGCSDDILRAAYSIEYFVEIVSIISRAARYPSNLQEFIILARTQIGDVDPDKKRKDEYEKKVYSKWVIIKYKTFKLTSKYLKERAQAAMREYFLMKEDKVQLFNQIFGKDRKNGIHNDAAKEILTNEKIIDDMLNVKYLEKTLECMNEQTKADVQTMLVEKFKACPQGLLELLNKLRDGTQDGVAAPRKNQSFKLPWSLSQNIQSLIYFLEKLEYRARKENLVPERKMIQSRIEHFKSLQM